MPDRERERLFTEAQVRAAFVPAFAGMVAVLVVLLILASVRPQGRYVSADQSQFEATVRSASADLEGFELVGEERARLDIDHAMELVAERGVGLELVALDAEGAQQAAGGDGGGGAEGASAAEADGEAVYGGNCAACHQANGQGVPGAFPPLAGNLVELVGLEGGRDYLIQAVLHGVQGEIEVAGQTYDGAMPAWGQLSDAEIAAVLQHELTAWDGEDALPDGFEPIAAEEVAGFRDAGVTPSQVLELRPAP